MFVLEARRETLDSIASGPVDVVVQDVPFCSYCDPSFDSDLFF